MEEKLDFNFEDDAIMPEGYEEGTDIFEMAMDADPNPTMEKEPAQAQTQTLENEPAEQVVPTQATEPTTAPQTEEQEPVQAQTIRIKYNHEEREIDLNEAATLAQKGMAYDKAKAKADQYEQSIGQMEQEAKALGYDSVQAMLDAARKSFEDHRVQTLIDEGNTEAMARFLVNQEAKERAQASSQVAQPAARVPEVQESPAPASAFKDGEVEEFVKLYPGVTQIPQEVIKAHREGMRLSVAFEKYQTKQAQEELRVLRQNQAAAAKAPVSTGVTGGGGGNTPPDKDPFLEGFDSDNW